VSLHDLPSFFMFILLRPPPPPLSNTLQVNGRCRGSPSTLVAHCCYDQVGCAHSKDPSSFSWLSLLFMGLGLVLGHLGSSFALCMICGCLLLSPVSLGALGLVLGRLGLLVRIFIGALWGNLGMLGVIGALHGPKTPWALRGHKNAFLRSNV
jgi:hypothetical protein